MSDTKILLIGAGKMGLALLSGWVENFIKPENVFVIEPHPSQNIESFVSAGLCLNPQASELEKFHPDCVVIAVKPQMAEKVLTDIKAELAPETLILSIMAGVTLAQIESLTGNSKIIRTMPNTPAAIGAGVSALVASDSVDAAQKELATHIMQAVGQAVWLSSEAEMDAVTAISGSGPAYVFYMVEALAQAGIKLGLPAELAELLAHQTVAGAGGMLAEMPETAEQLRVNVTSPNGTTQAALEVLMGDEGLVKLMEKATAAAAKRSKQLSEG
ncbi:MAG: pyrroline-5-carboxylate reductase [Parvibaculales bacterium]